MYLGCVAALLMHGDPCVTVTEPYISPCAYSMFIWRLSLAPRRLLLRHGEDHLSVLDCRPADLEMVLALELVNQSKGGQCGRS
jgi:hypothetical protein